MKKNTLAITVGCIAAAAAIAGAAYGVWKLLERKNACCCCDCEDEPDFCEDFDLDSEDYDCDCDDLCDDLCCEETEEPAEDQGVELNIHIEGDEQQ